MSGKDLNIVGYQYNYPKLFIKPPNGDEIDAETITSGLHFLDDDSDPILTTTYTTDTGVDGSVYSNFYLSLRDVVGLLSCSFINFCYTCSK